MTDQWEYCYDQGWGKNLVSESFSHPAKVSFSLAGKIYDHSINMKWVKRGDFVLDPFGGICGFGFHAMAYGLNFIGVELEEKFVKLGEQNIELWNRQLNGWPNLGTARIIQGDSRYLLQHLHRDYADLVVSSPPFSDSRIESDLQRRVANPKVPFSDDTGIRNYGHTPGNLANMKEGNIDCVISSPPFSEMNRPTSDKDIDRLRKGGRKTQGGPQKFYLSPDSQGQLGSMKEGSIDAVISSPPYENCNQKKQFKNEADAERFARGSILFKTGRSIKAIKHVTEKTLAGDSINNLGNSSGDTFWSASLEIVQQCYDLLKPNGHAIWICKDYVKNKKRVPFSDRWLALCESVGFSLVCRHQAMLVKSFGKQSTIHGKDETISVERKSFFRRLAESKGSPRIDWEDIICLEKK